MRSTIPAGGMPTTLSMGGPEDTLIEANTPAEWRTQKDAIFAGMDAYAVKALGSALMTDVAEEAGSLRADLPSITCPTTVIAGARDHPLVDQAPALAGEVAAGRVTVIPGAYHSPQLTHPAVRPGYLYPPHRLRLISPCKKLFADGWPVLLQVSR